MVPIGRAGPSRSADFADSHRGFQSEGQDGFGGYVDGFASGYGLRGCSGPCSREGSDCCAFSASCEGSDDASQRGTSAGEYGGPFIYSDSVFPSLNDVAGFELVATSPYRD